MSFLVTALYKFVQLNDVEDIQTSILEVCRAQDVYGTLLLAHEGINGTIAGSETGIRTVLEFIQADNRIGQIEHKESYAETMPFLRMACGLKKKL